MSTPEEEISLDSNASFHQSQVNNASTVSDKEAENDFANMSPRRGDIRNLLQPSMTDEQLGEALLMAPEEQLIPWESCKLPSQGVYYGWAVPSCDVRAMGQAADKILATQRFAQTGQSIDLVLSSCCRFPQPDFDPLDLLVGDRVFLLYYLRGITHGNFYEFVATCARPECGATSTHVYDLNELARTVRVANPAIGTEPFKVQLPYMSELAGKEVWVQIRFMRGRDTQNIFNVRRAHKRIQSSTTVRAGGRRQVAKVQTPDETMSENLKTIIVSFMGIKDPDKIAVAVDRLHSSDHAAIRDWLRENSPGIDTVVHLPCPQCNQEFAVELPITETFFRPTQKRGI